MRAELPQAGAGPRRAGGPSTTSTASAWPSNAGNPPFILHDGPPYANGDLHMGHFLNRVLKDAFVKINLLDGKYADFVPGWDMHGLPIETRDAQASRARLPHRRSARAAREVPRARAVLARSPARCDPAHGRCFGHYDDPYMTIDAALRSDDRRRARRPRRGEATLQGLARDAVVHARRDRAGRSRDRVSGSRLAVDLRALSGDRGAARRHARRRFGVADDGTPLSIAIWTTTPWTLPGNVAIAIKPDAEYALLPASAARTLVVAEALRRARCSSASAAHAARVAARRWYPATELVGAAVRHPFLDRDSPSSTADYVELDTGTGAVHTAPGHGADDFETGVRYGLPMLNPVDGAGRFTAEAGPYAGQLIFDAQQRIIDDLRAAGLADRGRIVRAFLSALLALQEPGHLPRDRAVVHRDGRQRSAPTASSTRCRT